eukprot:2740870-Rhodomonas_salina.3
MAERSDWSRLQNVERGATWTNKVRGGEYIVTDWHREDRSCLWRRSWTRRFLSSTAAFPATPALRQIPSLPPFLPSSLPPLPLPSFLPPALFPSPLAHSAKIDGGPGLWGAAQGHSEGGAESTRAGAPHVP